MCVKCLYLYRTFCMSGGGGGLAVSRRSGGCMEKAGLPTTDCLYNCQAAKLANNAWVGLD